MADASHGDLCPMCGHTGPHNHTPREVTIWRNGIKLGASLAKPHYPNEGVLMFGGSEASRVGLDHKCVVCLKPRRNHGTYPTCSDHEYIPA